MVPPLESLSLRTSKDASRKIELPQYLEIKMDYLCSNPSFFTVKSSLGILLQLYVHGVNFLHSSSSKQKAECVSSYCYCNKSP